MQISPQISRQKSKIKVRRLLICCGRMANGYIKYHTGRGLVGNPIEGLKERQGGGNSTKFEGKFRFWLTDP